MVNQKWYKLDNAAKVFPSVSNKKRTNLFRISFLLTEDVNACLLQESLELVLPRFSSLNVQLHHGVFWYYLEQNDSKPLVQEEDYHINKLFTSYENNGFLFRLLYYKNRISIEVFHALTDGTGAMQLLKSVVYTYLKLSGKDVENDGSIIEDDVERRREEAQDSFVMNYNPKIKFSRKESKALQIKGTEYPDNFTSLIIGKIKIDKFKEVCKHFNCTVTQLIVAGVIYAASRSMYILENKNKPFQVFIPVNLRKFFPSKTTRNFSLYIRTKVMLSPDLAFEAILQNVKDDMKDELVKEKLEQRIAANVKIEKNIFLRIAPLFIKEIAMKIGYNAWGESANSFSISNLGNVDFPVTMKKYIKEVEFTNGASYSAPVNVGVISYNDELHISFASAIIERNIQREFFRLLSSFGLEITINGNEEEE